MLTEEEVKQSVIAATYEDVVEQTPTSTFTGKALCLDYPPEQIQYIYDNLSATEKIELDRLVRNSPPRTLLAHQKVPLEKRPRWWEVMLLIGGRGVGKALALDTPIPTPTGWTTMGEIEKGDYVLSEYGKPIRVLNAYAPQFRRDCYRVVFDDGSSIVADGEHLWAVSDRLQRKRFNKHKTGELEYSILTTKELIDNLKYLRKDGRTENNYSIINTGVLELERQDLPLCPYLLGYWLGNGSKHGGSITTSDVSVLDEYAKAEWSVKQKKHDKYTYSVSGLQKGRNAKGQFVSNGSLHTLIKSMNLYKNKHVPQAYLRGSVEQRLALLQGLMDSDGAVDKRGVVTFDNTNVQLTDAVAELVCSLGMKCFRSSRIPKLNGVEMRRCYRVYFRPNVNVFRLERKANRLSFDKYSESNKRRFIVGIKPVASIPVRCILVDSPTHLFLAGEAMVPTHNTLTGTFAVREHLRAYGKYARVGVGAPTQADARDVCAEGDTGLLKLFPNEFVKYNRSLGEARHCLGGYVKFMGTEQPKRWNGPQWSMLWFDELALCNQAAWDDASMGLRLKGPNGEDPYALGTTTPKNRKFVKNLAMEKTTYVPQYIDPETGKRRLPTTFDNTFLPSRRVDWLKNKYMGTRLGQQELLGMFIDDVAGAKWKRDDIIHVTNPSLWPRMIRTVVAVDPAGSPSRSKADENALSEDQRQNQQKNCDTGISVIGLGADGMIYVLALTSGQWTPSQWGLRVMELFTMFKADKIIVESNFGGAMVESTIRQVNQYSTKLKKQLLGRYAPIKLIHASKGKHIRAEPVSSLYEQHRVVHTSIFASGEEQMCSFVDADENEGADMVDALVWGILEIAGLADTVGSNYIIIPEDPRIGNFIKVVR